ncbi:MAG: protein kinase [Ectothiorhodospiraceae bacterium]|nr:protein kinase [Ectothiorhodospiraceae bacterium]
MSGSLEKTLRIPGYRLERELGSGATASAYLAIQESLERRVAVKIMAASLVADRSFCARFLREGRIIAQLTHPHVVTIYDIGVHRSWYYMAEEYLAGGTLSNRIRSGLSADQAMVILCEMASALGYAHERGFVHRDVKPANILFRDNGVSVLTDFGIARGNADSTRLTMTGWARGTPDYMSPEQTQGKAADARSDLYSLGIVLYEMLTGRRPYHSEDPFTTALMHLNKPVPQLPQAQSEFQPLLNRLLAKDPDERFANADALIDAVQARHVAPDTAVHRNRTDAAVPDRARGTKHARLPLPTRRQSVLLGGGLVILLATGVGYMLFQQAPAPSVPIDEADGRIAHGDPELSPAEAQPSPEVVQLLSIAEAHKSVERLVSPSGSNAMEVYRRVLDMDPDNRSATAGLQSIASTYEEKARESLRRGQLNTSLQYVEIGLEVVPDHAKLLELREQIARQPKPEDRILDLLRIAEAHLDLDRLIEPPGSNAADVYRHVLELDPFNVPALAGLEAIADLYAERASRQMQEGELQAGLDSVRAGLDVAPDHAGLRELHQDIRRRMP